MVQRDTGGDEADDGRQVARFTIKAFQYLDAQGSLSKAGPALAQDPQRLRKLYAMMQQVRCFDARAIALQRTGQLGTYGSCLGQEAVGVAIGVSMRPEDVLLPTYREYAAQIMRGVAMHELLLYWGGNEQGMAYANVPEDFPICVPIAGHAPHAVGVAFAFRHRRQARVAVCVLGDGASSKGDFYEALNLAGAWNLPVVFVLVNNQWAISMPRSGQSAARTLAQKALAAGMPGEQVDGNDVIALCARLELAIERAREGGGPSLIEALTYRLGDHTTADDASRYRDAVAVDAARKAEPLSRLRRLLEHKGEWDAGQEQALLDECKERVEQEVRLYLDTPAPEPGAMFDHLYARLPEALAEQREAASRREDGHD